MKSLRIAVNVPLAAAVAAGRTQYGCSAVSLSDTEIGSLSKAARSIVAGGVEITIADHHGKAIQPAAYSRQRNGGSWDTKSLDVIDTSPATVLAALETRAMEHNADATAHKAELDAAREARIVEALAAPDEEWFGEQGPYGYFTLPSGDYTSTRSGSAHAPPYVHDEPSGHRLPIGSENDPRILQRRQEIVDRVLPSRLAEYARRVQEFEAHLAVVEKRKADEEDAHEAKREAYLSALRNIAGKVDRLARPAAEGYSIQRAVLDYLANELADAVGMSDVGDRAVDTSEWVDFADRAAPSPQAFLLRDRVVAAVRTANESLSDTIGQWKVSRIVRLDACPHQDKKHIVTAVLATLETPFDTRQITWSTESLACDHEEDDEE